MERRIEAAFAHRVLSRFYAAITALLVVVFLFFDRSSYITASIVIAILGAIAFTHHAISIAAENGRPWARRASLAFGILLLFGFPIGTIIGGFLIYLSSDPWQLTSSGEA